MVKQELKEEKGKAYSVYCSPEEIQIVERVKEDFKSQGIRLSNSEILKMAIRKLGSEYTK